MQATKSRLFSTHIAAGILSNCSGVDVSESAVLDASSQPLSVLRPDMSDAVLAREAST